MRADPKVVEAILREELEMKKRLRRILRNAGTSRS